MPTRRRRLHRRLTLWALTLPRPPRHSFIIGVVFGMAFNSAAPALGLVDLPRSLDRLPLLLARFGASFIFFGALGMFIGQLWLRRLTGLAIEVTGLALAIIGDLLYAYALLSSTTLAQRSLAFGPVIGFAIGSLGYLGWILLYLHGRKLKQGVDP